VLGQQIGKSDVRLEMINEYITNVLPSFLDRGEDRSELHPMLTTQSFTTYTKVYLTFCKSLDIAIPLARRPSRICSNEIFCVASPFLGVVCAAGRSGGRVYG